MEDLQQVLESAKPELERALRRAEQELEELRAKVAEREAAIARARAALGQAAAPAARLTLHEALEAVLQDSDNSWMSAAELAREVNHRALYRMRDGRPVEAGQIHARARNYRELFEIEDGKIRLRHTLDTSVLPSTGASIDAQTIIYPAGSSEEPMSIVVKVAYSVSLPNGVFPDAYAKEQSERVARRILAKEGFAPGGERLFMMTSTGLSELDPGWRTQ